MKNKNSNKFIFFLILFLIIFGALLQIEIVNSSERLEKEEIIKSKQYAYKITHLIQQRTKGNIESVLDKDEKLRAHLNQILQAFLIKQYKYIFVLKKYKDDKNGHYRFLLDGSIENPAEYREVFSPKNRQFDEVYKNRKIEITKPYKVVEEVWISLLYPIIENNQTEALLVLDLSKAYREHLNDFHSPLITLIWMVQLFLIITLLVLLVLAYRYYKLRRALLFDNLTGTHTKVFLEEFFNRNNLNEYNAILIDMDEFVEINKLYGYEIGDTIIKEFAKTILNNVASSSKVIRTSGTEFFIIIHKDMDCFEIFAKKLFQLLSAKKYLIENNLVNMTISMSSMLIPEKVSSVQNIQRLLDEKLLEIKSRGKNDFAIIDTRTISQVQYTNIDYIKESLEDERLICLYQPIYNTKTQKIIKYEALVRLIDKDDKSKLITPFYFMDMIKGTSQYIKMSKLVFYNVFNTLHKYPHIKLSVNLDLNDLYNRDMMNLIKKNLYENRAVANRLTFEILETNELKDYKKVVLIFKQLKAFGSKIALDDFGSGYTNYSYLIKLDIDILKIDGSLIKELHISKERAKIVLSSIQKLAKELNFELIAEFVSDESTYNMVKELDIEFSQGYYLGKPELIEFYMKESSQKNKTP
ncbi:MAG: bifunctional diguanylate cyclase/phosphodiesterase [Sulfurovum sp.]